MRILITGITGFVGSHLTEYILEYHSDVDIVGMSRWRSPAENIKHILSRIAIEWGDLEDLSSLERILRIYRPDIIFHLAAQSFVPFSFKAPYQTILTNGLGTLNLLEAIKGLKDQENYDPIIHICSSSEIYGQCAEDEVPITEINQMRPASPYAIGKCTEDLLAYQYFISWKLKTIRTRAFTHSGPRRGDAFFESTFAKQIAKIEKGLQEPIVHVGNLDSIRTVCDVRDMVQAYWLAVNKCEFGEVYNVGGVETYTVREILNLLLDMSVERDIRVKVDSERLRPSDVTNQIPDVSKFQKITGWRPEIFVKKMLHDLLNYWRKNV